MLMELTGHHLVYSWESYPHVEFGEVGEPSFYESAMMQPCMRFVTAQLNLSWAVKIIELVSDGSRRQRVTDTDRELFVEFAYVSCNTLCAAVWCPK
jgi:hypothetical protein